MKKTAIYPGTFDPITFGHIDLIQKSLKIVDKIIVAISDSNQKEYLFTSEERIQIVNKAFLTISNLSSALKRCFFSLLLEIATITLSTIFNDFFMTSIWPYVMGSKVPG